MYASMAVTALGLVAGGQAAAATISPSTLPQLTTIDERFQSYNVEMAEVIGGNFWKPYAARQAEDCDQAYHDVRDRQGSGDVREARGRRSYQRATAQARRRAGTRLCAGERHLGQFGLLPGYGRGRSRADAFRLPERADPTPMGRSYRLHPCGRREACDLLRHQQRRSRQRRDLDTCAGQAARGLHELDRRHDRRGRALQRADDCRQRRRTRWLQRR